MPPLDVMSLGEGGGGGGGRHVMAGQVTDDTVRGGGDFPGA